MLLDLFRKEVEFENIQGYDDLKDIVKRALDAEDNYNLLFIGSPASAKTLFLLGIIEYKKGVKPGIWVVYTIRSLFQEAPFPLQIFNR
jgi:hypothetical protein